MKEQNNVVILIIMEMRYKGTESGGRPSHVVILIIMEMRYKF